jgi:hypothetical protein
LDIVSLSETKVRLLKDHIETCCANDAMELSLLKNPEAHRALEIVNGFAEAAASGL